MRRFSDSSQQPILARLLLPSWSRSTRSLTGTGLRSGGQRVLGRRSVYLLLLAAAVVAAIGCISKNGVAADSSLLPPSPLPTRRQPPPPSPPRRPPFPRPSPPPPLPPRPRSPPPSPRPPRPLPPPAPVFTSSGVRLVRTNLVTIPNGVIGRLELLVKPLSSVQGYFDNNGWAPVCNDRSFSESPMGQEPMAMTTAVCRKMGYPFGRLFYYDGISSFDQGEVYVYSLPLIGELLPDPGPVFLPRAVGSVNIFPDKDPEVRRHVIQDRDGYDYTAFSTNCIRGVLVALHCSDAEMPPAVPPPPEPPGPPPPTPARYADIRLINTEPNLRANSSAGYQQGSLRIELLVQTSGRQVWAPLCVSSEVMSTINSTLNQQSPITKVACRQTYTYRDIGMYDLFEAHVMPPLAVPTERPSVASSGLFDPRNFTHWVTVSGRVQGDERALQELQLKVATRPCDSGYMYAIDDCQHWVLS